MNPLARCLHMSPYHELHQPRPGPTSARGDDRSLNRHGCLPVGQSVRFALLARTVKAVTPVARTWQVGFGAVARPRYCRGCDGANPILEGQAEKLGRLRVWMAELARREEKVQGPFVRRPFGISSPASSSIRQTSWSTWHVIASCLRAFDLTNTCKEVLCRE